MPGPLVPADPLTRRLAAAALVNTFGNGVFFVVSALFFTRVVGLPVALVGLGLTVGGGLGVLAGVPAGRLADHVGVKRVYLATLLAQAGGLCLFPLVHSFSAFLPVVCLVSVMDRAGSTLRNTVVATGVAREQRASTRAYLRAVTNVGIGAGAAVGAVALHADTRGAYVAMVLVDAATFVVAAAIVARMALPAPARGVDAPPPLPVRRALADRPYLAVTALNGVLAMQFAVFEVGLPLWIVGHTHAPRFLVSAVLVLNTVLVVLFQVRAARGLTTPASAARAALRAGLLLAGGCLLYGLASGAAPWAATVVLLAGCVVHTAGEVVSSAAGWALGFDLADPAAPGVYQGVFQTGFNLGGMLSPLLITATALRFGLGGWAVLGAVFVLAGAALVPVTAWAQRERAAGEAVLVH